jgi:hypothetical protein
MEFACLRSVMKAAISAGAGVDSETGHMHCQDRGTCLPIILE